jgi:hypothetical protein
MSRLSTCIVNIFTFKQLCHFVKAANTYLYPLITSYAILDAICLTDQCPSMTFDTSGVEPGF